MPSPTDIKAVFETSEKILRLRLEAIRSAFHHAGLKGSAVEDMVREFLREILPSNIGVGSGIIIDTNLNSSRQVDIVLFDKARTPVFFNAGGAQLYPIECVYFAIEVKTVLTPEEFDGCVKNMDTVKALERTAYIHEESDLVSNKSLFGKTFETWETIYLVFSLETRSLKKIMDSFIAHRASGRRVEKQIDTIYCLDSGVISNMIGSPENPIASLLPKSPCYLFVQKKPSLFTFLSMFSVYYNQVDMGKRFNFLSYSGTGLGECVMVPKTPLLMP